MAFTYRIESARDPVPPGAVVPEDFPPRLVGETVDAQEGVDGLGVRRVVVRPVGRDDYVVVADRAPGVDHERFVGIDGHVALALEVVTRHHRQPEPLYVAELLPAFV